MTGKGVEGDVPQFESALSDFGNLRQGKYFIRFGWQEYMSFSWQTHQTLKITKCSAGYSVTSPMFLSSNSGVQILSFSSSFCLESKHSSYCMTPINNVKCSVWNSATRNLRSREDDALHIYHHLRSQT
jgi:hypothetical protein